MYTKKSSLFFVNVLVITILSCIANLASAQSSTSTDAVGTLTSQAVEVESEATVTTQETDTKKSSLEAPKRTRLTNLIANISNRIEAGLTRLGIIKDRIESRVNKMETEGLNMTDVKLDLIEVNDALTRARLEMETIDTQVVAMVNGDRPSESWKNIRETLVSSAIQLQNAKVSLTEVLVEMRSAKLQPIPLTATTSDTEDVEAVELTN